MKKILITLGLLAFSAVVIAQTGRGWDPIRKKTNFRDSTYFTKDAHFASSATFDNGVNGGDLYLAKYATISAKTDSYELSSTDEAGYWFTMSNAGATNFTIPLNATVAYPIGTQITLTCISTGTTTIVLTGGVTGVYPADVTLVMKVKGTVTFLKIAADTWVIAGNLVAA